MKTLQICSILLFFSFLQFSCKKLDPVQDEMARLKDEAIIALNDGINTFEDQSGDWQAILKDLENKIDKRVEDLLTYNMTYINNLAKQRGLSTVACVKENLKDEVLYYLEMARSQLLTGVLPALPATTICQTSLSAIDLNKAMDTRSQVIYSGYFIHNKDSIKAFWVNEGSKSEIPASKITFPDISTIKVSLVDYADATITTYTQLQLFYNNEVISSIGIDKKSANPNPVVKDKTRTQTIVFIPPHTNGDRDFSGNGPKMTANLSLTQNGLKVFAQVYLSARETKSDWTTASGYSKNFEIYTVPSGYRITRLTSPSGYVGILKKNGIEYVDTNHNDETITTFVGSATLVGDVSGPEAGDKTKITLVLNPFNIEIQKL